NALAEIPETVSTLEDRLNLGISSTTYAILFKYGKLRKSFEYYPFHDWFGRFIALPEIEKYGDAFCVNVTSRPVPENKRDACDGSFIRQLPGPNGGLFLADRGSEGRWLFKFHADGFNPEGLRLRGRTNSTTVMGLICLNLPLHMANDPAYMYIPGLIQGPHEPNPKNGASNHYLKILMDDLAPAYERGITPYSTYGSHGLG
ncbi:hypothetical protein K435DRAFT_558511, partial [Dendrothele bispora CBS 962.96]